jgi:hypothetical protein
VTRPARNTPRERAKPSTKQLCCFIASGVKDGATAHAEARGETLRKLVERALVRQMEEDARAADS